jgi:NagD protein
MDTDILAGIETEIDTCLVLSGITTIEEMKSFAYQPKYVLNGVIDIIR